LFKRLPGWQSGFSNPCVSALEYAVRTASKLHPGSLPLVDGLSKWASLQARRGARPVRVYCPVRRSSITFPAGHHSECAIVEKSQAVPPTLAGLEAGPGGAAVRRATKMGSMRTMVPRLSNVCNGPKGDAR
jgi:hypothetical protein